jgi:hypothetical protein
MEMVPLLETEHDKGHQRCQGGSYGGVQHREGDCGKQANQAGRRDSKADDGRGGQDECDE